MRQQGVSNITVKKSMEVKNLQILKEYVYLRGPFQELFPIQSHYPEKVDELGKCRFVPIYSFETMALGSMAR